MTMHPRRNNYVNTRYDTCMNSKLKFEGSRNDVLDFGSRLNANSWAVIMSNACIGGTHVIYWETGANSN